MVLSRKLATIVIMCLTSQIFAFLPPTTHRGLHRGHVGVAPLRLSSQGDDDFWTKQKKLAAEMTESSDKILRAELQDTFTQRRNYLLGDTAYVSVLIFAVLWGFANTVFTPISFAFGSTCGLAYSFALTKFVGSLGGSFDDEDAVEGAGIGQARFAFLFLLILFIGKYRSFGLQEIPSILGFFTYQIATLGQGLRETDE